MTVEHTAFVRMEKILDLRAMNVVVRNQVRPHEPHKNITSL